MVMPPPAMPVKETKMGGRLYLANWRRGGRTSGERVMMAVRSPAFA
jgi:hypothetical protein